MANDNNKLITIVLAVVIVIALIVVVYVNLPRNETTDDNDDATDDGDTTEEPVLLTLIYDDQEKTYTLEQLESLDVYTGLGGYINQKNTTMGPYNYTGVTISTLLNELNDLPENYTIKITASDTWETDYTKNETLGNVEIKNETAIITGTGGATMIVAYKEEGEYITDTTIGPLRVAYVDEYYTPSSLWTKMVVTIEVIAE